MTGLHVLRDLPRPRPGAYHIGGSGASYEEAIIRTLGETVERYAQFISANARHDLIRASYEDLVGAGRRLLVPENLQYFSDRQLARPGFPFSRLLSDSVIGWVSASSLVDGSQAWAPAQMALVGYSRHGDEPRIMSGVTTGTAAHTRRHHAVRSAILELIQIDAAVGHWYGHRSAVPIGSGQRTRAVDNVVARLIHPSGHLPRFYWLPNADLPGIAVACMMEGVDVPHAAIGLGCDLRLTRAMYKAFMEAVAVLQLAKVVLFRQAVSSEEQAHHVSAGEQIYDLDSNVAYYAVYGRKALRDRFPDSGAVDPDALPADIDGGVAEDLRLLIKGFADTGKELVLFDLTTADTRELGFSVARVWSPDLLSLPLPSAPPAMHARFRAYGGFADEAPHPYP